MALHEIKYEHGVNTGALHYYMALFKLLDHRFWENVIQNSPNALTK
jgi:hypothetical protein